MSPKNLSAVNELRGTGEDSEIITSVMKVAIVGAGPVGCATAISLAKKGHRVSLYETYGEKRECKSRSINITLSERGIQALEAAIPEMRARLLSKGAEASGRIVHSKDGKVSAPTLYGRNGEALVSFKRNMLCDLLIQEIKKYKNIEIFFEHELITCEPHTAKLTFKTKDNKHVAVDADFVIGADGVHSTVRYFMQKNNCLQFFEQKRSDHFYIEFQIPKNNHMKRNMLHVWPRHDFMLMALPNNDGTFCGNLYMVKDHMQRVMENTETFLEFCRENCPDLLDIIGEDNFVKDVQPCVPYNPYPLTSVKCEPYHAWGKALIIGDAAHAVVPFYGQGMNSGFQDCQELMAILDQHGHSKEHLATVVQEFSEKQCKNGQAIADLAFEHYTRLRSSIAGRKFYIRHAIDELFNTCFSDRWPLEYGMVAFTQNPYSAILQEKRRQDRFLANMFVCVIAMFVCICILCC